MNKNILISFAIILMVSISMCLGPPSGEGGYGQNPYGQYQGERLPLPDQVTIDSLTRNYPSIIKSLNEGPNIYPSDTKEGKVFSDEEISKIKDTGFNTVQIYIIGQIQDGKRVLDDYSKSILLNNIVKLKQNGLAVWIAFDTAGVSPNQKFIISDYGSFKQGYLTYISEYISLLEQYKVEYLTTNNEPDLVFMKQTQWTQDLINNNLADFIVSTTNEARKSFNGRLINKITQPKKRADIVLEAAFTNIDIAGVDVGPPMDMNKETYTNEFVDYQYFADLAKASGVSWMNSEYWQSDFDTGMTDVAQDNQLEYAKISFAAYLAVTPKGLGYVWNDMKTFETKQGEETRLALKEFFNKI